MSPTPPPAPVGAAAHPGHQPSIGFILLTMVVDALGFGIVVPIVPRLVQELSGRGAAGASVMVGALLTTFACAQLVSGPVLGGLSDRFGRRVVLLLSLGGGAANYVLLAFAPSLVWLFLGRVLAGATAGNVSAASAYIADVTPVERRAQRFGLIGAAFSLGFVVGPVVGGALGGVWLRLPFLAAAGLAACNMLYGMVVLPESLPPARRRAFDWRRANPVASLHLLGMSRAATRLGFAWCCIWFAVAAMQSSFVLSMALRFGWGVAQVGIAFTCVGVASAVVQSLVVRPVTRRIGERRAIILGFSASAGAALIYGLATTGGLIFVAIALDAFGALAGPSIRALVSGLAPPDRQGEMQGALTSVQGLTAIVAPLIASALFGLGARGGWGLTLPGAPFLLSTLVYAAGIAAVSGITDRPPVVAVS